MFFFLQLLVVFIEKIEINTHKIDLKPVEVPALIVELVEDFAPAEKVKNIEIKIKNIFETFSLIDINDFSPDFTLSHSIFNSF